MKKLSRQSQWQLKKMKEGFCRLCGKNPIYKGSCCKKHYEDAVKNSKNYYKNLSLIEKKKMIKKDAEYKNKRIVKGICVMCGKKNDREGRVYCSSCAGIMKRKYYRYVKKIKEV